MRVALTHAYSWPEVRRGAERIIVESARALARRGHDVTIFTSGWDDRDEDVDGYRIVRFRRRFHDGLRHERWFGLRLLPALARARVDVVHSFMPRDAVAAIRTARITGHRTLYDEMGIPGYNEDGPPAGRLWDRVPDRRARLRVVKDVDVYACMSHYAVEALEQHCGRPGVVLPGGVRLSEFRPAAERADQPTVLFMGALDVFRKGIHLLLEAVGKLAPTMPDLQLWLSGPGDPGAALSRAPESARERTTVLHLGDPGDQAERYAQAWVTALPSWGDSFGMVTLESLAAGTPIAVTDSAAPQEIVTPQVGAVARAGDPASIADAVQRCLALARDPATAARCRDRARPFDWDDGLAPMLEHYYTAPLDKVHTPGR